MAGYTREQLDNIRRIKATPEYKAASPKERKSLFEATTVESDNQDLNYGDRDSKGILQQRNNGAWGAAKESVETDVGQYLKVAREKNATGKYGSAGKLAQAVQGSAFRERYQQRSAEADKLVGRSSTSQTETTGVAPKLNPGGTKTDAQGAVTAALLDKRKGMSLVSRMQDAISSGKYTSTTAPSVTPGKAPKYNVAASGPRNNEEAGSVAARADAIDSKKMPYLWGGGHGGKVDAYNAAPLDCSGAVSAVLGLNPRVASQFKTWGSAGDGGSKGVTVYAKDTHVLMKINGHFFGTSGSNPGGGAGWIKQSDISPDYLKGFTARHG